VGISKVELYFDRVLYGPATGDISLYTFAWVTTK
jgi:hypothetical protein